MPVFVSQIYLLTLSAPASLTVCRFYLYYPHKISCFVMRIKQIIIHSNLSKMKIKILPACLQGNYRDSLGEFSNMSDGVLASGFFSLYGGRVKY